MNAADYPLMYIFSSDPGKNNLAHKIFSPLIYMSGGTTSINSGIVGQENDTTQRDRRPIYLDGTEQIFSRVTDHYDAFFDIR